MKKHLLVAVEDVAIVLYQRFGATRRPRCPRARMLLGIETMGLRFSIRRAINSCCSGNSQTRGAQRLNDESLLHFRAGQPAASSSSAGKLATASSSVAQPATPHRCFVTLKDLREWLQQLPEPDQSSAPVRRVRNALSVLELPSSRAARSRLQALLQEWDIRQYQNASRKHLTLPDAQERLSSAVLAEGSRLRAWQRSAAPTKHANFQRIFHNDGASPELNATARGRSRSTGRRSTGRHVSID